MSATGSSPILQLTPSRKRKRDEASETKTCILCNEECAEDKSSLSAEAWERMKDKASDWKGLLKFGDVFDTVNWEAGPEGVFFHKRCRITLASKKSLDQARRKQENNDKEKQTPGTSIDQTRSSLSGGRSSRSKGLLHHKHMCIWCMKPDDSKHGNKLSSIQQWKAFNTFKCHTLHLEDEEMRDRILKVIDSTPDPFAAETRYHRKCWGAYIKPSYKESESFGDQMHVQNVRLAEVKEMFFKHI